MKTCPLMSPVAASSVSPAGSPVALKVAGPLVTVA